MALVIALARVVDLDLDLDLEAQAAVSVNALAHCSEVLAADAASLEALLVMDRQTHTLPIANPGLAAVVSRSSSQQAALPQQARQSTIACGPSLADVRARPQSQVKIRTCQPDINDTVLTEALPAEQIWSLGVAI